MNLDDRLDIILEAATAPALNPKLWDGNQRLHPKVLHSLLQVAYDFAHKHGIPQTAISDVVLTGSLCGFRWTKYSDVDLHLVIDFDRLADDDLAKDYYDTAKTLWNKTHDIEVCGHDVEIYVQDRAEPHVAPGVYSLSKMAWVKRPKPDYSPRPSPEQVDRKARKISSRIDDLERLIARGKLMAGLQYADELKAYIGQMRTAGLREVGENSVENLAFKQLRNQGDLDRLAELKTKAYDDKHSVRHCQRN